MLKQKKIAFFIGSLTIGGVEKVSLTYINALVEMEYDITCIVCNSSSLDSLLSPRVKLINLNVSRLRNCILSLAKVFIKNSFDIVVCANIQTLFVYIAKLIARDRFSIITSHHFYCNNVETPYYYKKLLKFTYNRCDHIIAVSEGIKEELKNVIKVKKNLIWLLNNPIDVDNILEFAKEPILIEGNSEDTKIVWVGRMNAVKNLKMLIDSIIDLKSRYNNVTLHLIGGGQEYGALKEYVMNEKASDYIFFYGVKQNPYPYISMANIVALSSSSEAYPTILLESLCLGKTCVSTPTNGANEILEKGKYGYISSTFNSSDFVDTLSRSLDVKIDSLFLMDYAKQFDKSQKVKDFLDLLSGVNNQI